MVKRMGKYFNVTGNCIPGRHYMVNLDEYYVVPLDFQALSSSCFRDENRFSQSFARLFAEEFRKDNVGIDLARMFGFVQNDQGKVKIANRIYEICMYKYYLPSFDFGMEDIMDITDWHKDQFGRNGRLNL